MNASLTSAPAGRFPVRLAPRSTSAAALFVALAILLIGQPRVSATSFIVNSTGDAPDAAADGICQTTAPGECTLRAAIQEANVWGNSTIAFNIPGSGVHTIRVTGQLPAITADGVRIDGYTQPGAMKNTQVTGSNAILVIELDGSNAGVGVDGLRLWGTNGSIRGLVVNRFSNAGISIAQQRNTVAGNFVGTNPAGTAALPNGADGIYIGDHDLPPAACSHTIGGPNPDDRNLVSGNRRRGISLDQVSANTIQNNYVGVTAAGDAALGNGEIGIAVFGGNSHRILDNVSSGNASDGFWFGDPSVLNGPASFTGLIVQGNHFGTSANGAAMIPNGAHGIALAMADSTLSGAITNNTITGNAQDGVAATGATHVSFKGNAIYSNGQLGIDLGGVSRPDPAGDPLVRTIVLGDGVTGNDPGDMDAGPNGLQNYPVLARAIPRTNGMLIQGAINSTANHRYRIEFFASDACDASGYGEGQTPLSLEPAPPVLAGADGFVIFERVATAVLPEGKYVTALATDTTTGDTSEFSRCIRVSFNNDSWPNALRLAPDSAGKASASQFIDRPSGSRWYKFAVPPGATVNVKLSQLPADYDLVLFRDIARTYASLRQPQNLTDLAHVNAEFAPEMFTPEMFTPEMFTPEMFTPEMFTPEMFTPEMFTPEMFTPEMFTPEMFTPEMFTPEMFTPEMFTPEMFTPEMFTPEMFTPEMFTPEMFTPEMFTPDQRYFSDAQRRSAVAVNTFAGVAPKTVTANAWSEAGDFYVLVSGRNGAYDPNGSFRLDVAVSGGQCAAISSFEVHPDTSRINSSGGLQTLVLADFSRMGDAGVTELRTKLGQLKAATNGEVVDLSTFPEIEAANSEADTFYSCVTARNAVAYAIKDVVDAYRRQNPGLKYIVLVGNDHVIPFFRYPDQALLGQESGYVPPVRDATASEASLRLGYFLSQDTYGATTEVSRRNSSIPAPGLAVGRLVETPGEIGKVIDAFLDQNTANSGNGAVIKPTSALVTGYDFLADAAAAVGDQLASGLGPNGRVSRLISANTVAPANAWSASDLSAVLLGSGRHDLVFLAGHFNTFSALAADYNTRLLASDISGSNVDMTNTIVFSNGCHSGYNTVNEDSVPDVTVDPDFAQAFARKGATLVAGTGYQYGDTDFIEYSERLYVDFSQELRRGSGPVAVGDALVRAKQDYLSRIAMMRPIHVKALYEVALFGLPMLAVDMPGARYDPASDSSIVTSLSPAASKPGATLGLQTADVTIDVASRGLTRVDRSLSSVTGGAVTATYWQPQGAGTLVINPNEPVLPLLSFNVNAAGYVMRGAGFRGGAYTEIPAVIPFTSAATTEIRGIHTPFVSNVYYPIVPWDTNYFDALARTVEGGITRFNVTPVQYRSDGPTSITGTVRRFDNMAFRLFYSANTQAYQNTAAGVTNVPALASPPVINRVVSGTANGAIDFSVNVTGDPSAGIQTAWVTYTSSQAPFAGQWQSLDLGQDPNDSTLWVGTLDLGGSDPASFRFIVQAANGVGLVSLNTNRGAYFTPDVDPGLPATPPGATAPAPAAAPTALQIVAGPGSGKYGTSASFTVRLTSDNRPLAGQPLLLGLTTQQQTAYTDANGQATIDLTLIGVPGPDTFRAAFTGSPDHNPAFASAPFTTLPAGTTLTVKTATPAYSAANGGADLAVALADETGRPLPQKGVLVVIEDGAGNVVNAQPVITDLYGNAVLKTAPLKAGSYTAFTYFGQVVTLGGESIDLTNPRYGPASASTSFVANTPPTPNAGGPYSVYEGDSITLTATASDPDAGQALRYYWDLDANGSYETEGQSVIFAAPAGAASLSVGLKVCDPLDCATASATVTVLRGSLHGFIYFPWTVLD